MAFHADRLAPRKHRYQPGFSPHHARPGMLRRAARGLGAAAARAAAVLLWLPGQGYLRAAAAAR